MKKIEEHVGDEIRDMKNYAKMALGRKDRYPDLAEVFYKLYLEEKRHAEMFHSEAVKMIEAHKKDHGDMNDEVCAVYNYIHKNNLKAMKKAKRYHDMYLGLR